MQAEANVAVAANDATTKRCRCIGSIAAAADATEADAAETNAANDASTKGCSGS
jgi:hypothetical protein